MVALIASYLIYSPLYQVVPHVVTLVQSLKNDGLPNSKTFLLQFAELIHCMMYQYSGFPDLYDSILESIKVRQDILWANLHTLFYLKWLRHLINIWFSFRTFLNLMKRRLNLFWAKAPGPHSPTHLPQACSSSQANQKRGRRDLWIWATHATWTASSRFYSWLQSKSDIFFLVLDLHLNSYVICPAFFKSSTCSEIHNA